MKNQSKKEENAYETKQISEEMAVALPCSGDGRCFHDRAGGVMDKTAEVSAAMIGGYGERDSIYFHFANDMHPSGLPGDFFVMTDGTQEVLVETIEVYIHVTSGTGIYVKNPTAHPDVERGWVDSITSEGNDNLQVAFSRDEFVSEGR